ncbi:MAG: C25 family cysteine peptidase [Bacteroidales bacterium]|nr:C25 family cysteine peptidase [Bacteroidales bacterium]
MKKIIILGCLLIWAFGGVYAQSERINSINLDYSDGKTNTLSLKLTNYGFDEVTTPRGKAKIVVAPNSSPIMEKGAPDLPKFTTSLLIPDVSEMEIIVKSSNFVEYSGIEIAPSKGNLMRNISPENTPYEYGSAYEQNKYFPSEIANLDAPYILRDYSGQAVHFYPFCYNPATKILRVYTEITVEVREKSPLRTINPLYRTTPLTHVSKEFSEIYERQFINYRSIESVQYTPLEEQGRMLIISYGPYITSMQPFVDWKNTIGIKTTIVDVSTIGGTTPASVKSYIQNYYDSTDLAFVLLVGDNMHVAPFPSSTAGITGPSDNNYAYLAGNDHYADVFIGRFSAESTTHVQTMVNRTLSYEKVENLGTGWFDKAMGVARNEGAGQGHNGESDCQHMDLIRTRLLNYNYTTVHQEYDQGCTGVTNTTATIISNKINSGVSIINYCNHGSPTGWSVANYSATNVNALTNVGKWPFIWAVACVNGEFINQTCFAESWLRATYNSQPSGALATLMSTINQSWHPPMDAQDEFNDILIESYANNIKRTFGGISFNGMFKMNDINGSAGSEMADTWTIFGDPSVMIRSDDPLGMTVSHPASIMIQETSVAVNVNVNGAFVCLSKNGNILGTGTVANNTVTINFSQLTNTDSITVAVTAYNRIPYIGKIAVLDFLYNVDAGITAIISPESSYICDNINVSPEVVLRNNGLNPLTSVTINYKLDNGTVSQFAWAGNLASLDKDTITLPQLTLQQGAHTFVVYSSLPNGATDQNTGNDSKSVSFQVDNLTLTADFVADMLEFCNRPAVVSFTNQSQNGLSYTWNFGDGQESTDLNPVHIYDSLGIYTVTLVADAGICGQETQTKTAYIKVGLTPPQIVSASHCGPGSVTLQANGSGTIKWYDDAATTNLVNTGNTFVTPVLNNSTTYYVREEMVNPPVNGGKANNSGSGDYFGNIQNQHYLIFNAFVPFKLISVKVYAGSAGVRIISLRDSYGNIIQSITVTLPAGESRATLNFNIPVGTGLRLQGDGSPDLFRNNNNSATYPYTTAGMFSITESSASLPQYNTFGNYYYFYDWEAKEEDCFSAVQNATASIIYAPTANFTYLTNGTVVDFTNTSQYASTYLWNFGDGTTSTAQNPTHIFSSVGTFTVTLLITNDCGTDSISETITTTAAAPLADFYADNITVSEGDFVNFHDISANAPNDWHWIFEGGTPSSSTLQNPIVQYNTAGTYYVTLVATNAFGTNFMNKPSYITVLTTSINEEESTDGILSIYPNPASEGFIDVSFNLKGSNALSLKIFNAIGDLSFVLINNETFDRGIHNKHFVLNNLSSGVYYLVLQTDKFQKIQKFLIAN